MKLTKSAWILLAPLALLSVSACAVETESESGSPGKANESAATKSDGWWFPGFNGCRGDGHWVCDDLVDPNYYRHHAGCTANPQCEADYYPCSSTCPAPAADEIPNVRVNAAGASTTNMSIDIGYIWTSGGTGGFYHNWENSWLPWVEYTKGVGVNVPADFLTTATCYNYQSDRKFVSMTVTWKNGATQTFPCSGWSCQAASLPLNGGLTATCYLAAQ